MAADGGILVGLLLDEVYLPRLCDRRAGRRIRRLLDGPRAIRRGRPFLDAMASRVALGPLFILWLGIDLAPKVLMVASLVFFVVANTRASVRDVNPDYINVLRILGAAERQSGEVPAIAALIYASLQVAFPWALIGAVIGEMIASETRAWAVSEFSTQEVVLRTPRNFRRLRRFDGRRPDPDTSSVS